MPAVLHPADVLSALRPDADRRSLVDPGLAGGLRAWLEDGVADALATACPAAPAAGEDADRIAGRVAGRVAGEVAVVDRWALARSSSSGDGAVAERRATVAGARQAMVGCLFRQLVTTGAIGRPFDDAIAGLRVAHRGAEVVAFVSSLPRATRHALRRDVVAHADALVAGWPPLPPRWLPRTTARRRVPLAGGRAALRTTVPLVLGQPAGRRASVCLVDVRAGDPRPEHGDDRRFLALVETLCGGAPPCRVASYYPFASHLEVEDPDDGSLASTVVAVLDALHRRVGSGPGAGAGARAGVGDPR